MSGDLSNWYLDSSKEYAARVRAELDARWQAMSLDLSKGPLMIKSIEGGSKFVIAEDRQDRPRMIYVRSGD